MAGEEIKKYTEILTTYDRWVREKGIKEVYLKMARGLPADKGKGIVRLDETSRKELGVNIGDKVDILGPRVATAIVEEADPEDAGKEIVRVEDKLREYIGVSLDVDVCLRKAVK